MKITLKNDFHHTTATVHAVALNHEINLTKAQMKRAEKKLCGISGCTCGGPAGIRGPQSLLGKTLVVNICPSDL